MKDRARGHRYVSSSCQREASPGPTAEGLVRRAMMSGTLGAFASQGLTPSSSVPLASKRRSGCPKTVVFAIGKKGWTGPGPWGQRGFVLRQTVTMPLLTDPLILTGVLAKSEQPAIVVDDELSLRPWTLGDAAAVVAVYQDSETQRWHARTVAGALEAEELMAGWRRGWAEETGAGWAVVDGLDVVVGRIALGSINLHEGVAGVGYWTAPEARGRGVAPRALRAVAEWAIDVIGLHRLELEHSTLNDASCRVALKAGFSPEGTRFSAGLHQDGWHDMHVHALIAHDQSVPTAQ